MKIKKGNKLTKKKKKNDHTIQLHLTFFFFF